MSETTGGRRELAPISFRAGAGATSAESASLAAGTYFTINEAAIQTREGKAGEEGPYLTLTGVTSVEVMAWQ